MALTGYLLDTSVMHRLATPEVIERVEVLGAERPLYRCALVDLEVLRSAISSADYESRRAALISGFIELPTTLEVMTRALETQRQLAAASRHRGVSLADLAIAACTDVNDAIVLHYDGRQSPPENRWSAPSAVP